MALASILFAKQTNRLANKQHVRVPVYYYYYYYYEGCNEKKVQLFTLNGLNPSRVSYILCYFEEILLSAFLH
jgi:Golgi nucleoside diphosphatase